MRYLINYLLIALLSLSQISCTTSTPIQGSGMSSSQETITSFLITPDRGTLVVVGQQHHFIMSLQEPLRSVLQWKSLHKLKPSFGTFHVDNNQAVNGTYTLQASLSHLQTNERQFLEQHGFRLMSDQTTLSYTAAIKGTRYLAGNVQVPQTAYFTTPYDINVIAPATTSRQAENINLTPITLVAGGVELVLGSIFLVPLVLNELLVTH